MLEMGAGQVEIGPSGKFRLGREMRAEVNWVLGYSEGFILQRQRSLSVLPKVRKSDLRTPPLSGGSLVKIRRAQNFVMDHGRRGVGSTGRWKKFAEMSFL